MQLSRWKKVALGFIASILLGGVGSGVWEVGLKPLGQWLGRLLLTAATLGSNSVKDSIYREAAKGFHEASSLELFWLTVLIIFMFSPAALSFVHGKRAGEKKAAAFNSELNRLDEAERSGYLDKLSAKLDRQMYALILVGTGLWFLFASIQFVDYLKLVEANLAYTYFTQSMTICRPYVDDQQARMLQSRFASINGRDDFIKVTNDLKHIAVSNRLNLPNFTPW
jgi:hypothetical protein